MVMETYYRKRFKRASQRTQMGAEQGRIGDMQSPVLGRHHHVPPPPSSNHCTRPLLKVGCVYEIDHVHLPKRIPAPLRSIRVAMVCEKTEMNVAVRYPSKESLRAFFSYSKMETHPTLDEKFIMGTELAEKVLVNLVPAEIFFELKNFEDFWLLSSDSLMGDCLSEALKGNGMVGWGIRRQVKYLGRHREINDGKKASSSFINGGDIEGQIEKSEKEEEDDGDEKVEDVKEKEKDEDAEDDENEEDVEEEKEEKIMVTGDPKRKRYTFRNLSKKKPKVENEKKKKTQSKRKNRARISDAIVLRNPKDRWSSHRYKLAEKNLLEVMKMKGAIAQKPILRPQLREEARKKIGDTGLLDHLLKHLAGKLAPGGKQRFRRRHNADGAMEYWLESADLVNVRLEAGIKDPYWVPPPGWKPGDSPTQDPICARELKILKDELENIKRDMDMRATKKHLEEEVQRLRREVGEANSKRIQEENQAITITSTSSPSELSQKLEQLAALIVSSKSDNLGMPLLTLEKYKEQLLGISDFVKEIEANIGKLTSKMEQISKLDSTLMIPDKEKNQDTQKPKTIQHEVQTFNASDKETEKTAAAEQKAAKIQRLKSGFKLCKQQGTFLWPGMNKNDMVLVQVDVPTPPSVSSSTALAPPQLPYIAGPYRHPKPPLKPLAERGGLTVTVSTVSNNTPSYEDGNRNYSTTMINLNDAPTISTTMSLKPRNGMCYGQKECNGCCCSSSSASYFHSQLGNNWLALSDGASHHG